MTSFKKISLTIQTIFKLGISNVAYVAWYRFTLKSGFRKHFFPQREFNFKGDLFFPCEVRSDYPSLWKTKPIEDAENIINGNIRYYAHHWKNIGNPPNWFLNPFNHKEFPESQLHWTQLPDFDAETGDIKNIWEASRFEWVSTLSRAFAITSKPIYLETLNNWIKDWAKKNPLNEGPNWKCGQEASIRVFNLMNAALILGQAETPAKELNDLIYAHLERINDNIRYALAQDNNHGTSEATALFIGGNWLHSISGSYPKAVEFSKNGRDRLENRITVLVEDDGGFSQHSITYHRILLDTIIFAEFWRQKLKVSPFTDHFYRKANASINWLWLLTDKKSGDCPNLGSNDGALFLNTHSCDYRDFRPTLQTASVLFSNTKYFESGIWDEPLYWFDKLDGNIKKNNQNSASTKLDSGYVALKSSRSWCLLRFPHFRFRPYHNDVFHFDLWYNGVNIITDSGTYSYHPSVSEQFNDFKSVHVHNTVSFDQQEQMPALGRFLLGNWVKPSSVSEIRTNIDGSQEWSGSYADNQGNHHIRHVSVKENVWEINDTLSGNFAVADIGFNIADINCQLTDNQLETNFGTISFPENLIPKLVDSFASTYYMEKHPIKRLIIKVSEPGTYKTIITLK